MRLLPRGVRTRITVSVTLLTMVVVALAGLAITWRINQHERDDVDRQLTARADQVRVDASYLLRERDVPPGIDPDHDHGGLLAGSQSLVRLLDEGTVVAEQGEHASADIPVPTATGFSTIAIGRQSWRSLVVPLGDGEQLQVLQSLEPLDESLSQNGPIVAAVAAAASAVAAIGVWIVAGLVLQPLQRLRTGAQRILPGDVRQRLPVVRRPREVADLAATLNGMLERLQVSMQATRRFTADAGHELRTPLTSLGVDLETLLRNPDLPADRRRQTLAAMAVQHERIVALLDGLQALARGDTGAAPARESVDLVELVDEAVVRARVRHPGVTYLFEDGVERAVVRGWPAGLTLAVDNLLNNAALHGKPDGTVRIAVTTDDLRACVTVADDGPGIPPAEREAMKGRFTRGERPRGPGSGLGLALVDQQAGLHGGELRLGESAEGGLLATMVLPVTDDS